MVSCKLYTESYEKHFYFFKFCINSGSCSFFTKPSNIETREMAKVILLDSSTLKPGTDDYDMISRLLDINIQVTDHFLYKTVTYVWPRDTIPLGYGYLFKLSNIISPNLQ